MATDYYMVLARQDGTLYTGESMVPVNVKDPFPGRPAIQNVSKSVVEIIDFSFQVEQGLNVAPTSTSGRVTFGQMRLVKKIDILTPTLFQLCAAGTNFKFVDFLIRKSTGADTAASEIYLAYGLEDVIIKSVAYSGNPDAPTETLSLEYRALKVGYQAQNPDGTAAAAFTYRSWDQVANTP
jgi:type VI secretion system Hcp family effector